MNATHKAQLVAWAAFSTRRWTHAVFRMAFLLYAESDTYHRKVAFGGRALAMKHYGDLLIEEYVMQALTRHWGKIIFRPWTISLHPDIINYPYRASV